MDQNRFFKNWDICEVNDEYILNECTYIIQHYIILKLTIFELYLRNPI